MTGYNPNDGRPLLNEWFARIKTELNPHYDEAHKFVYMLTERDKGNPLANTSKITILLRKAYFKLFLRNK